MHNIRILGAQGSRSSNAFTTCIQITHHTVIDAGNIMQALGENALHVNNIFFSHSHLDHIIDSAFLIDNSFANRTEPLYLYGLPETIQALREHIFNQEIWPDFSEIHLIHNKKPAIVYKEIEFYQRYEVEDGIFLTPIPANHSIACCGYLIENSEGGVLFSGDSYKNEALWKLINTNTTIKALIIDVSFPSQFVKLAHESKHLTPQLLHEEMQQLHRTDVHIYVNHLKPFYHDRLIDELKAIGINEDKILHDGESISLCDGLLKRSTSDSVQEKIKKLTKIGAALSAEENLGTLLEMIVSEAKALTRADGGTLYLVDGDKLRFKVAQTDSLNIKMGGTSDPIKWLPLPLYLEDGTPNKKMVAATCVLEDRLINISDVYQSADFSFEGAKKFDESTGYLTKSMLVIPLKDHERQIIGVLQLLNKQDSLSENVVSFGEEDEDICLSLASQAAIAINNTSLIQGLETLLEAFLRSIIFAIGKKSPYTAGHIERMVKLSMMMAEAIHENNGIYKEKTFSFKELRQINFAALMHDIGKLATPEQVVDKSTKLVSLFDRLELIECRFEVIKKALHVAFLEGKITQEERNSKEALLEEYLVIIRKSNTEAEFTNDSDIAFIQNIFQNPYIIDGVNYPLVSENEAYNLCIQRGTLTKEERDIINQHAQISIDILNNLPFPKKYKEIPQISGNHHEKINGKGYPQGLKGDEISFEARILAIADVFEALTASDRPYKKGMPLSFAMKILYYMAKDDELDRQMVKFFYESGLYLEYAQALLPQSSIDEVTADFSTL